MPGRPGARTAANDVTDSYPHRFYPSAAERCPRPLASAARRRHLPGRPPSLPEIASPPNVALRSRRGGRLTETVATPLRHSIERRSIAQPSPPQHQVDQVGPAPAGSSAPRPSTGPADTSSVSGPSTFTYSHRSTPRRLGWPCAATAVAAALKPGRLTSPKSAVLSTGRAVSGRKPPDPYPKSVPVPRSGGPRMIGHAALIPLQIFRRSPSGDGRHGHRVQCRRSGRDRSGL